MKNIDRTEVSKTITELKDILQGCSSYFLKIYAKYRHMWE